MAFPLIYLYVHYFFCRTYSPNYSDYLLFGIFILYRMNRRIVILPKIWSWSLNKDIKAYKVYIYICIHKSNKKKENAMKEST